MADRKPVADSHQISFGRELIRKGTHMGALVIPGGYYLLQLDKLEMLAVMMPIAGAMVLIDVARLRGWWLWRAVARPVIGPLIRHHESAGDFIGATYILLSVCLTVALYDKPIAIAALVFIMVGDTLAALVGRKFGRHRWGRKSLEGSLACLVSTVSVALFLPGLALNVALAGAEELVDGAYEGASFINELFDECWTIVTCPVIDEICDNGCDDDFDGYTDLDDSDCLI